MLAKRLCSNNARPSGSSGMPLTSFTLQLRRTVTRLSLDHFLSYRTPVILQSLQDSPLSVLPYTLRSSDSAGQPTSRITVHPSSFSFCRTAHFLYYRTPFILQSLQDSTLPVVHPSFLSLCRTAHFPYYRTPFILQSLQDSTLPVVHPSFFSLCRTAHFPYYRTPFILQSLQENPLPVPPYTPHSSVTAGQTTSVM